MSKWEKIDTVEIVRISRHGSGHYLRLRSDLIGAFELKKGDRLRVKIESVNRGESS